MSRVSVSWHRQSQATCERQPCVFVTTMSLKRRQLAYTGKAAVTKKSVQPVESHQTTGMTLLSALFEIFSAAFLGRKSFGSTSENFASIACHLHQELSLTSHRKYVVRSLQRTGRRASSPDKDQLGARYLNTLDLARQKADSRARYEQYFDTMSARIKGYDILPENI